MGFRLRAKKLSAFSRQLGTMLDAGLPIRRALSVLERTPRSGDKALYRRIGQQIETGQQLSEALENEGRSFPPLFIRLVRMGEITGGLDNVLKRLADYYDFVHSVWTRLITRLAYPFFQFWALILVLAIVKYIFAMIAGQPDAWEKGVGVLIKGAIIFFIPIVVYFLATRLLGGLRAVHEVLTRLPLIGRVMSSLALARFSWSMELMTDSGVNIFNALEWSLQATSNGAFEGRSKGIMERIRNGVPLSRSLELAGLFPVDYVQLVNVAEESGSMPVTFGRLAKMHFERAESALKALTSAINWGIYATVAGVIIYYIFKLATLYIGAINSASDLIQ